jgi:methyl-accepting chemotaxis protein
MFNWLKSIPIPSDLIYFTVIFVLGPTIGAVCLRYSLYQHLTNSAKKVNRLLALESRGQQPKIVENLEKRFRQAREKLEQVNTMALIDGVYSQEKFTFFRFSLRCEQWDYFCQTLPNLLLAFGLLGTFFGITINLSNISQTLDINPTLAQGSDYINEIISKLQAPLQSMGIAFVTSLIAILCSSLLIIINLRYNTNLAKSLLISSLEDYLDNVFQCNIEGISRIDLAIDRMVNLQYDFLTRFHEKIGQVLETTIGNAANKMVTANQNFQNNVDTLVSRFQDVSGSLANTTSSFKESAFTLNQHIEIITKIVPQVEEASRKLENGSIIFQLAANKIEQSKFSENLENITSDLATTQKAFSQSTAFLGNRVIKITESHEQAVKLAEQVYTQLQQASEKLQDSALGFVEASAVIQKSNFADTLASATKELTIIPQQFTESTAILHQSTHEISMAIASIQNSTQGINKLIEQVNKLNQYSTTVLNSTDKQIANQITSSQNINSQLSQIVNTLQKHQQGVNQGLENLGSRLLTSFEKGTGNNIQQLQGLTNQTKEFVEQINFTKTILTKLSSTLETYVSNFDSIKSELSNLVNTSQRNGEQLNLGLNSLEIISDRLINTFQQTLDRDLQQLQKVTDQFSKDLKKINTNL